MSTIEPTMLVMHVNMDRLGEGKFKFGERAPFASES